MEGDWLAEGKLPADFCRRLRLAERNQERIAQQVKTAEFRLAACGDEDAYQALHPEATRRLEAAEQGRLALEARLRELESGVQVGQRIGSPPDDLFKRLLAAESRIRELEEEEDASPRYVNENERILALETEGQNLRTTIANLQASKDREVEQWKQQVKVQMERASKAEAGTHRGIQLKTTERESEMLREQHQQALSAKDQEIDRMKGQIDKLCADGNNKIESLRQQHNRELAKLQDQAARSEMLATQELERSRAHAEAGERHAAEIEVLRARDAQYQVALADFEAYKEAAAEAAALRGREAEYKRALADLEAYKARAAAGDRAAAQLEQLQRNGSGSTVEVEMLRNRLREAQDVHLQAEALRAEREQLRRQHEAEVGAMQQQLTSAQRQCDSLRLAAEQHQRAHEDMNVQHGDQRLPRQSQCRSHPYRTTGGTSEELQVQHGDLMLQQQALRAGQQRGPSPQEYEELSAQHEQVVVQMETVQAALNSAQGELALIRNDNEVLQVALQASQQKLNETRANSLSSNTAEGELLQQRNHIEALELENSQLVRSIQEMEGENLKLKSRVCTMESKFQGGASLMPAGSGPGSLSMKPGIIQPSSPTLTQLQPPSPNQPLLVPVRLSQTNVSTPGQPPRHRMSTPCTAGNLRPLVSPAAPPHRLQRPSTSAVLHVPPARAPEQRPEWRQ